MATSFADIAQALRDRPAINYSSSKTPIAQVWYESVTVPSDCFGACPILVVTEERQAIDVVADVAGNQNGLYFDLDKAGDAFRIFLDVEPWGDIAPTAPPNFGIVNLKANSTEAEVAQAMADQIKCFCDKEDYFKDVKVFAKDGQLFIHDEDGNGLFGDAGTSGYTASTLEVTVCNPNIPTEFRVGSQHPNCEYLELIDAWMTGGDDHHMNWIKVYEVNYGKLEDDCDDFSTDDLLGDVTETDFPYFDDARRITEQLDIVNAQCYVRKPQCSAHPCYPNALLVSEKLVKDGAKASVTRVYHDVTDLAAQAKFGFEVSYECQDSGDQYPIVTWTYDSKLEDYAPPQCGSAIPINQGGDLNFAGLGLVLIEPPTFDSENTCFGKVTAKYGRLPGYLKASEQTDDDYGTIYEYNQVVPASTPLPAIGSTYEGNPVLNAEIVEEHCCVKKLRVITGDDAECIKVSILPDQTWCSITRYEWKNAAGDYVLPETGDTYSGRIVLDATSQQTKCAGERQIGIDTVLVPSPVATATNDDATFCELTTETWVDLTSGITLPALGDVYGGAYVVGASSTPKKCDLFSTVEIQVSALPSPSQIGTRQDNDFCEITTISYIDLAFNVAVLDLGDDYAPIPGTKVIEFNTEPYKCAELQRVTIAVASFPAPEIATKQDDDDFCEVTRHTKIVESLAALPSIGDTYNAETVIAVNSEPYRCDELFRQTVVTAATPSPVVDTEADDNIFCKLYRREYIAETPVTLPALGDIVDGLYVVGAETVKYRCDELQRVRIERTTLPSPIQTSQKEDRDFCEITTVSYVDLTVNIETLSIGDDYTPIPGTKVLSVNTEPYKCAELQRVTIEVAEFPSPTVDTERDDNLFCKVYNRTYITDQAVSLPNLGDLQDGLYVVGAETSSYRCDQLKKVSVDRSSLPSPLQTGVRQDNDFCEVTTISFIDLATNIATYNIGDDYAPIPGTKIIKANTEPYKCAELQRISLEVAPFPAPAITTIIDDNDFCLLRRHTQIVEDLSGIPDIGGAFEGETVINVNSEPYRCDELLRQTVVTATFPSPVVNTERDDNIFCKVHTSEYIEASPATLPGLGDLITGLYVIGASTQKYKCDQLERVTIERSSLPSPLQTSQKEDRDFCEVTEVSYVDLATAIPALNIGDDYPAILGTKVLAVNTEPYKCDELQRITITVAAFPAPEIDTERDDNLFCKVFNRSYITDQAVVLPDLGDLVDGLYVIGASTASYRCDQLKKVSIDRSSLPSPLQTSIQQDNDFCEVTLVSYIDLEANVPALTIGDDYAPIAGTKVLEISTVPYKCTELQRIEIKVAPFPAPEIVTEVDDNIFCKVTRHSQIVDALSLPAIGDAYDGRTVIAVDSASYRCDELFKQVITTAVVPGPLVSTVREDRDFCEINTDTQVVKTVPSRDVGDGYSGGKVVGFSSQPYKCDKLFQIKTDYATVPSPEITTASEDRDFCEKTTTTQIVSSLAQPSVGDVIAGGTVIATDAVSYLCDTLFKSSVTTAAVPSPEITTVSDDRDFCEKTTTTQIVDANGLAALPSVGDAVTGGVVIATDSVSYLCDKLFKTSVTTAVVPSPEISTVSDDKDFCEKTTTTQIVDDNGLAALPSVGDNVTAGVVIATDSVSYLCDKLFKTSVTTAVVPSLEISTVSDDKDFCEKTTTTQIVDDNGLAALPSVGDAVTGGTVIAVDSASYLCDKLFKSSVTTAAVPSPEIVSYASDKEFCERTIYTQIVSGAGFTAPQVGDSHQGGFIVDVDVQGYSCDALLRVRISTVPTGGSPWVEGVESDRDVCEKAVYSSVQPSTYVVPAIGDNYQGGVIVDVDVRKYICDQLVSVTLKTIPSAGGPKNTFEQDSADFGTVEVEEQVVTSNTVIPAVGAAYGAGHVINLDESVYLCDKFKKVRIVSANLADSQTQVIETHPEFCKVTVKRKIGLAGNAYSNVSGEISNSSSSYRGDVLFRYEQTYAHNLSLANHILTERKSDGQTINYTETTTVTYGTSSATSPSASNLTVDVSETKVNCNIHRFSITNVGIPSGFTDYETVAFTFPPLYRIRLELPMVVSARVDVSFSTSPGSVLTPYKFYSNLGTVPDEVDINGVPLHYQIQSPWDSLRDTLHNQINIFNPSTSRSIDALAVYLNPSSPSLNAYLGSIGNDMVFSDSWTKWKAGIWRRETKYIKLQ